MTRAARAERVPHIGWNLVTFERRVATRPTGSARRRPSTTCTRSSAEPADEADVVGRGEYGEPFVSIVERGNVMGVQFHPEKSSRDGLALLRNFAKVGVAA